jgi:hypothetical protein
MRISREPSPVQIMRDQQQLKNVEYFICLGKLITNYSRCTSDIKSRNATVKAAFNKKKTLFTSKLDLNLRIKLVKCYIWSMALCDVETWTLQKVDQKKLGIFDMWSWRRMEMMRWTNCVKNEEVVHRVTEDKNILQAIKQ